MESARTILFVLFAFFTFLLYQAWQEDNKPAPVQKAPVETSLDNYQTAPDRQLTQQSPSSTTDDLAAQLPDSSPTQEATSANKQSSNPIEVVTDTLRVLISPVGGNLISAELFNYKETKSKDSSPINLLENRNGRVFLALSGLYGEGAPDFKDTQAVYQSAKTRYELADGKESIDVDLTWINANGVEYMKRFTFHKNQYLIDVKYFVNNLSNTKIANRMFTALKRDLLPNDWEVSEGIGMQSYLGPAYSTEESKYEKYEFSDLEEANFTAKTKNGWVAILQHYFVTAWIPVTEEINHIDATSKDLGKSGLARIRITQDWVWIEPGKIGEFSAKLYVGPKIQSELEKAAKNLDLTVDYGFLWWIGQPIFYLLIFFQGFVVNWGLAIILVTIAIKMLLYPLARAQYRSFAKMRLLQPKMAAMKERYGDDRQQMSMKMMELYKKEKVNPLGGCFPLLIQMPVFIALYWVLMESVELRHAPFFLWINDLAVKDPYYILPLLMGASMYLMQKMQPMAPTMDPMQQKMMQMMPVFMTIFFVFFPAGLVLYWLMNNLISIAQQLYITNQFNKEQEAKKS
ncbi:membrane protein insertase YidC [Aliikangiella sp. IMCC44359]|uniref:membrane protein insertase YidC n=1 Tax=Aliikangiella sp. IMCC44359 TaxID=3459125 RepID=UPI00403A8912